MIRWKFAFSDQDSQRYLPLMLTDITLENDVEKIIIDAKYHHETMSLNYDKEKIKSVNLYQLFSYLLNHETSEAKINRTRGVLLYPTIEKYYDLKFQYQSHSIAIKTVNLNEHWVVIDERLKEIASRNC